MNIAATVVSAVLISALFGGLVTVTTWPDTEARRYMNQRPADAVRRGLIVAAATAIWVGFVLAAIGAMLS